MLTNSQNSSTKPVINGTMHDEPRKIDQTATNNSTPIAMPPPPPPPLPFKDVSKTSHFKPATNFLPNIPPPPAGFMQAPDGSMTIKRKVQTKYKLPTLNWVAMKPNQVSLLTSSTHFFL